MKKKPKKGRDHRGNVWLWLVSGLGLFLVIGTSISRSGPSARPAVWYQLDALVPGERVPVWLHTGQLYRGEPMPGGVVKLFAPDSETTAIVSASLLTEVERHPG
jgi:hypothetical protein